MPLYDFRCKKTDEVFERFTEYKDRHYQKCGCGSVAIMMPPAPLVTSFPSGYFRDIAADPIYIGSKQQMKDACKQHGCYAPGVIDGGHDVTEI